MFKTAADALAEVERLNACRHWAVVDLHAGVVIETFVFRSHARKRYHTLGGIAAGFTVIRTTKAVGARYRLRVQTLADPKAASIRAEDL